MGYERYGRRDFRDQSERRYGDRPNHDAGYRETYHSQDRYGPARDKYYREGGDAGRPPRDYDNEDRGFLDRAGDEVRSWFGDEEAERRRRWDERVARREYERTHGPGSYNERYAYGAGLAPDPMFGATTPGYGESYGVGRGAGATGSGGLGADRGHDGWGRDPNHHSWRSRQVEAFDRDYDEYRREHQDRFNSEFASWRTNRDSQRRSLTQAQEGQEVVGSDGVHVGKVDHVRGDRILLTKSDKDSGGHHHSIPSAWIVSVDDKVKINRTATQAQLAWKDEEGAEGPHNLNRAFSGTY